MNLNLKEKIAVITGADSGIGLETAKLLVSEGANVVLSDLEEKSVKKAVKEVEKVIKRKNRVIGIAADITKRAEVDALAQKVEKQMGKAHIVINSAGARGAAGNFLTLTDKDWQETIEVDLLGAVRICRAFIPHLLDNNWGRLILVSSENAFQPYEEESPYNACKAGIINLAKCLSRSYSKENLLINCVSPAYIKTPMTDAMMEELAEEKNISMEEAVKWFVKNKRPHIAMQRRGKPEEVASLIAFMCSGQASFINGSNYRVDGGSVESAFG
ncbi:SDR family NAD(P)-dependent oxidoreductase [Abyssalbus ytuae]|uniref:SDR family oxidoreductase n=1 Tax=Abyssalbus ytuae TaxID=2926907 RepID=A0A9E7D2I9_9FLAO|nr:SDR family oxidoreductase [Abyssalbus ytuae]UOB16734.1 SDR family oxidoreductase [Abyssalbus ytuae]